MSAVWAYVHTVVRSFVLAALLLCMFVLSFFGAIRITEPITGDNLSVEITGIDAVCGMFRLIDPPTTKESINKFTDFLEDKGYKQKIQKYEKDDKEDKAEKCLMTAMRRYGVLHLVITEETKSNSLTASVILWGVSSLTLMVSSLVFFILALVHAVEAACKMKQGTCKHETLSLALMAALAFSFVITGDKLGGAVIAILILGLLGLGGVIALRYAVEKQKFTLMSTLRRAICLVLAVITACLVTTSAVRIKADYSDKPFTATMDVSDLFGGLDDAPEEQYELAALDESIGDMLASSDLNKQAKKLLLISMASPAVICFGKEVEGLGFMTQAVTLVLFVLLAAFAAMMTVLLMQLLREEADVGKRRNTLAWNIATLCLAVGMTAGAIVLASLAQYVTSSLDLHLSYSPGASPICGIVFAVGMLVVDCVLRSKAKKKAVPPVQSQPEQMPTQEPQQTVQEPQQAVQELTSEQAAPVAP